MNVFIAEDEKPAFERLVKMLREIDPDIHIAGSAAGVQEAVRWFNTHVHPDLAFFDIQLGDGSGFEIFNETQIKTPVIFTTAYDEYALKAFKINSVDYLLKPIKKEELAAAINKYKAFHKSGQPALSTPSKKTTRFMIRYGHVIKAIETEQCAFFFSENKNSWLRTFSNETFALDLSLDEIEKQLEPQNFFRINRKVIVNIRAIDKMMVWTKGRVKLVLKPAFDEEPVVSAERSAAFKVWLTGG